LTDSDPNVLPDITNPANSTQTTYHGDAQGTTVAGTSSTGNLVHRLAYDAFGAHLAPDQSTLTTTNAQNNPAQLGANGTRLSTWGEVSGSDGESDDSLTYLRARILNAKTGLFISTDPHAGSSRRPESLHKFVFSNNRPTGVIDPSGRFGLGEFNAAQSIQLELANIQTNIGFSAIDGLLSGNSDSASSIGFGAIISLLPSSAKLLLRNITERKVGNGWVRYSTKTSSKPKPDELETSLYLAERFGSKIFLRGGNLNKADALIDGLLWEIKSVSSTSSAVSGAIRRAVDQGAPRLLLDGRKSGLTVEVLEAGIARAARNGAEFSEIKVLLGNGIVFTR
jgi:Contact-dependent growth inhibition CdiA C-terminal domain